MKLRAKDIAKALNISETAVSLVLNNKPGIGEEKRQQILDYVRETGYKPTIIPEVQTKANGHISFVIYRKHGLAVGNSYFYSEIMEEIEREARIYGYSLGITYINEQEDHLPTMLKTLKNEQPEGIILLATEMWTKDLKLFKALKIPLVILDNSFEDERLNSVSIDNAEGVRQVVKYLEERGHQRIAYLHSCLLLNNFEQRFATFRRACDSHRLSWEDALQMPVADVETADYAGYIRSFDDKQRPTAVIADNDTIALAAMRHFKENAIRVPGDISVVGFDDTPMCEIIEPPLTSVHVYKRRLGDLALRRLMDLIREATEETVRMLVGTRLSVRQSVKVKRDEA